MNRLMCPDIPSELLLQIIEAAVESQISHWKVTEAHDIHELAAGFFAWPDSVPHSTREVLNQAVVTALLRKCIIRIPVSSEIGPQSRAFRIPPALEGNENRVSRLVVDIKIFVAVVSAATTRDKDLAVGARDMDVLAKAFPRLEVCTFLLHLEYHVRVTRRKAGVSFEDNLLRFLEHTFQRGVGQPESLGQWVIGTIEDCLVDFIVAFSSRGPGMCKLIRFSREVHRAAAFAGMCLSGHDPGRQTRPLVSVSSRPVLSAADTVEGELSSEEESSVVANAKRILDKAYQGPWVSA